MTDNIEAPCRYLPWDSAFFGLNIARVVGHRLRSGGVESIVSWCQESQIDCLYFLADAGDAETLQLAEDHLFRLVDVRITLMRDLHGMTKGPEPPRASPIEIRPVKTADIPVLKDIAGASYHTTRFYADRSFPESACRSLYETWIESSCQGYADRVLVAEVAGRTAGYITCHLERESRSGQIGLVGVAAAAQNQGVGKALVRSSLVWFAQHDVESARVVTQGRNVPAQRLYQSSGFRSHSVQLWYHKWFSNGSR